MTRVLKVFVKNKTLYLEINLYAFMNFKLLLKLK